MVPIEYLREIYEYHPEGRLALKYDMTAGRGGKKRIGDRPGGPNGDYWRVIVPYKGKRYDLREHRVIFAIVHGRWPDPEVDHINGDPTDNRIENLREADRPLQMRHRKVLGHNKTGHKYIGLHQGYYRVRVPCPIKRQKIIGLFKTLEEALACRDAWLRKYGDPDAIAAINRTEYCVT